jgi:hypothetical protein
MMKPVFALPMALAFSVTVLGLTVLALAGNGNNQGQIQGGDVRGAPGPVVGTGLPVILIGGGIYWLVRRRKGLAGKPEA